MSARDIVIVGGGPAGITTALALQRAAPSLAARVIVLEKATYPREKYCAGAFGMRGEKLLAELDAVPDVPSAPIDGMSLRTGGSEITARSTRIGRVVRRIEFDHALAGFAKRRGIEIAEGTRVESIQREGTGARVITNRGEIAACAVVGADGVGSVVRKAMGMSAGHLRAQVLEVDTEPVPGDRDRRLLHFDASDRRLSGYAWDFPTVVNGRTLVCRGVYRLRVGDARTPGEPAIEEWLAERLRGMGLDLAAYKNKRYAERGFEPAERVADGPMMLVGEAAGIDPVTGEGIAQAVEYGVLAGRFLARALTQGDRIDGWARTFGASRLARDLRIRRFFVQFFYGTLRPELERFLVETPDALHVGCQHFAALPYDKLRLGEVLVRGLAHWAGAHLARGLKR